MYMYMSVVYYRYSFVMLLVDADSNKNWSLISNSTANAWVQLNSYHSYTANGSHTTNGLLSLVHQTFEGKGMSGNYMYCKQSMDRRNVWNVYYYNIHP